MERLSLVKNTQVKEILLNGLVNLGYTLARQTNCVDTPIYLFFNTSVQMIAIYNCKLKMDEFILVDYGKPGKLKVIIDEFKSFSDPCHKEISSMLDGISDGSFFREHREVTYL